MTDVKGNPLGIREIEDVVYIPLKHISEEEVERLRQIYVPVQPTEDEAEKAPGIKDDADEQARKVFQDAVDEPISDDDKAAKGDGPISPADALG